MNGSRTRRRLDSVSIAGIALFSALAIILSGASQALGLNFPLIPYLQFDVGEVAIVLAFFFFGPAPAFLSSFVEFAGLMVYGQQVPIGPILKLFALLSTVFGLWVGAKLATRSKGSGLARLVGSSALLGAASRALVMTIPNFYLILFLYGLGAIEGFLKTPFAVVGLGLNDSNALLLILAFTAIFNVLQILFVISASYFVLRVPAVSGIKVGGKSLWFALLLQGRKRTVDETIP